MHNNQHKSKILNFWLLICSTVTATGPNGSAGSMVTNINIGRSLRNWTLVIFHLSKKTADTNPNDHTQTFRKSLCIRKCRVIMSLMMFDHCLIHTYSIFGEREFDVKGKRGRSTIRLTDHIKKTTQSTEVQCARDVTNIARHATAMERGINNSEEPPRNITTTLSNTHTPTHTLPRVND